MQGAMKKVLAGMLAGMLWVSFIPATAETIEAEAVRGGPATTDERSPEAEFSEEEPEESEEAEENNDEEWVACNGETVDYVYQGETMIEQKDGSLEIEAAPFDIYQFTGPRAFGCNVFTFLDAKRKVISACGFPESPKTVPVCICPKGTAYLVVPADDVVVWDWDDLGIGDEEETKEHVEETTEEKEPILWKRNTRGTLSVMGDSISTFLGYLPEGNTEYYDGTVCGVSSADKMWWGIVAKEMGYRISTINAWSGSRVTTTESVQSAMCMARTGQLAENGEPDIIIILAGINDFIRARPLGTWAGKSDIPTDGTRFREAYAMMLDKIQRNYPLAQVYCCTLPACEWDARLDGLENNAGQYLHEFNEAIREIAAILNCGVIELNACGINRYNMETYLGDYYPDNQTGLHPNARGQELMARKIIQSLR